MNNYELMNQFIQTMKDYYLQNPELFNDKKFVYSRLISFNIQNNVFENITNVTDQIEQNYRNNPNIYARYEQTSPGFLWFSNGKIRGNEIKLYIPLDLEHIYKGSMELFNFISSTNIEHQSKIAKSIRNDNIVLRINNLKDAQTIINFVKSNNYIQEGLLKTNPFLPNCNGVGITMDNTFSFNSTVSETICEYIKLMVSNNRIDLININGFNQYLSYKKDSIFNNNNLSNTQKMDLSDIYELLYKTTSKNYSLNDFVKHANNKLLDKYTPTRERIVNPSYYLENALMETERKYPGNGKNAILNYLKGNPNYFTNDNRVRESLIKYVKPSDIINIMRSKLTAKNIAIPHNDNELIDNYLNIIYNKNNANDLNNYFNIIKDAYLNTMSIPKYGKFQADGALEKLINNNDISSFTNQFGDRDKLSKININLKKILLSGINLNNLDLDNTSEIINIFYNTVIQEVNVNNISM